MPTLTAPGLIAARKLIPGIAILLKRLCLETAASGLRNPHRLQEQGQRTEFTESVLEEVGPDKGGQKEPVWMMKKRTYLKSQSQREHD